MDVNGKHFKTTLKFVVLNYVLKEGAPFVSCREVCESYATFVTEQFNVVVWTLQAYCIWWGSPS